MPKMDINLRNVLSASCGERGGLKQLKTQLMGTGQWDLVLLNVKYTLRLVLEALNCMHSQGYVHRNINGL